MKGKRIHELGGGEININGWRKNGWSLKSECLEVGERMDGD